MQLTIKQQESDQLVCLVKFGRDDMNSVYLLVESLTKPFQIKEKKLVRSDVGKKMKTIQLISSWGEYEYDKSMLDIVGDYAKYRFSLYTDEKCKGEPIASHEGVYAPEIKVMTEEKELNENISMYVVKSNYQIPSTFWKVVVKGYDGVPHCRFTLPEMKQEKDGKWYSTGCIIHKNMAEHIEPWYEENLKTLI